MTYPPNLTRKLVDGDSSLVEFTMAGCLGCFDTPEDGPQEYGGKRPTDTSNPPQMISLEVIAPAGKLGVVFKGEKSGNGHTVHKVRDGSTMSGQRLPGDKVVSVNDEDTTSFDHDQMAALLSKMADVERKLVVMRPAASA